MKIILYKILSKERKPTLKLNLNKTCLKELLSK